MHLYMYFFINIMFLMTGLQLSRGLCNSIKCISLYMYLFVLYIIIISFIKTHFYILQKASYTAQRIELTE